MDYSLTVYWGVLIISSIVFFLYPFKSNRWLPHFLSFLCMLLLSGLRSEAIGKDVGNYVSLFKSFRHIDLEAVFTFRGYVRPDYGYYIITKFISVLSNNTNFFLFIIAFLTLFLFSYFIYKESTLPGLSVFLFISTGFYMGTFNIMRQYLAMSVLYMSIKYIRERKFLSFLIIVILASTIHPSSLFFLILYPLYSFNVNIYSFFSVLSVSFLIGFAGFKIAPVLRIISENPYFQNLGGGGHNLYFILVLMCLAGLLLFNTKKDNVKIYFHSLYIAILLQALAFNIEIVSRITMIFQFLVIILIPNLISNLKNKFLKYAFISLIVFCGILYYSTLLNKFNHGGVFPYLFYFQH